MNDLRTTTTEVPDAVEAVGQSRGGAPGGPSGGSSGSGRGEGRHYLIDRRVGDASRTQPPERSIHDPLYRSLAIYALSPDVSKLDGGVVSLSVPYEPLEPGPVGAVVAVSNEKADGEKLAIADLNDPLVLMRGGYQPSMSRPEFHQQMVYAVAMLTYVNFSTALGRTVAWAFRPPDDPRLPNRLLLRPHGAEAENAWYDGDQGEIVFGYFKPRQSTSIVPKHGGYLFTCVLHDIIAHEMSHALLDGLRARFDVPSHAEALAFHEAFADLVAFFQHFTFAEVVEAELAKSRGRLQSAGAIVSIAREFGRGMGIQGGTLRTVCDPDSGTSNSIHMDRLDDTSLPHKLGRVLVHAIFDAFLTIYERKTRRYVKLATGGTGELPAGDLPVELLEFLVVEACDLADQFLKICIRAIDYCPPVDVRFGDYLRALITADRDIVPDDKWAYREAIIQAFGGRGIYGEGTPSMTEEALNWNGPRVAISEEYRLSFGGMHFNFDPARPADPEAMRAQARMVGELVTRPEVAEECGIVSPRSQAYSSGEYDLPMVTFVRPLRRIGPDQQIIFDVVAEVIQRRSVRHRGKAMTFYGGSTIIFGAGGDVRYIVRKRVEQPRRVEQQFDFAMGAVGQRFWFEDTSGLQPDRRALRALCAEDGS